MVGNGGCDERQGDHEGGSHIGCAVYLYRAVHGFDSKFGQWETDARAYAVTGLVGTIKWAKNAGFLRWCHADALVAHVDAEVVGLDARGDEHLAACRGKLDGVGEQILHGFVDIVGDEVGLHGLFLGCVGQRDALVGGVGGVALADCGQEAHDVAVLDGRCGHGFVGGEFGYVEYLVDEAEQSVLVADDVLGLGMQVCVFCRMVSDVLGCQTYDGERGTKLVGDAGEETLLGVDEFLLQHVAFLAQQVAVEQDDDDHHQHGYHRQRRGDDDALAETSLLVLYLQFLVSEFGIILLQGGLHVLVIEGVFQSGIALQMDKRLFGMEPPQCLVESVAAPALVVGVFLVGEDGQSLPKLSLCLAPKSPLVQQRAHLVVTDAERGLLSGLLQQWDGAPQRLFGFRLLSQRHLCRGHLRQADAHLAPVAAQRVYLKCLAGKDE